MKQNTMIKPNIYELRKEFEDAEEKLALARIEFEETKKLINPFKIFYNIEQPNIFKAKNSALKKSKSNPGDEHPNLDRIFKKHNVRCERLLIKLDNIFGELYDLDTNIGKKYENANRKFKDVSKKILA